MKKEFKITYSINGKTKAGKFCSQVFCSSVEKAIEFWCANYPRFNGRGVIKKQLAEYLDNGFVMADASKWENVFEFQNNKELKNLSNLS
jgi:hypothetical protein